MSEFTNWLFDRGITENMLIVLSFVPMMVTLISVSRYITGFKTFGIYTSMILAISYYFIGIKRGLFLTILVIVVSYLVRNLTRKIRLHYLSKLSIIYIGTVILLVGIFAFCSYFSFLDPLLKFQSYYPLPFIMIISLTDRFIANLIKKAPIVSIRITAETIIVAVIGWLLMDWDAFANWFINNLWVILILIPVNILIGKYNGFRWTDFIRFNQVIKNVESTRGSEKK